MSIEESAELKQTVEQICQEYQASEARSYSLLRPLDNLLGHVGDNLYSDDFHFILELIQNAVDSARPAGRAAQPVSIRFHLQQSPPALVVSNDGAPFTATDIQRICGQIEARKGPRKIGYKGIGFKSVVRVTDNPQIYSPGCRFEFDKRRHPSYPYAWLIIPHWIEGLAPPAAAQPGWVSFVLPLREGAGAAGLERLSLTLDQMPPELQLFLDGLAQLELLNEHSGRREVKRRWFDLERGYTVVERSSGATLDSEPLGRWVVEHYQLPEPSVSASKDYAKQRGLEERLKQGDQLDFSDARMSLAFQLDGAGRFVPEDGPLYAFFPVKGQRSGLRFALQADFLTTASREALSPPAPGDWNSWLISNLPEAIVSAAGSLKSHPRALDILYDALPLECEGAEPRDGEAGPFSRAVQRTVGLLRDLPIVATDLTGKLAWVRPSEAAMLDESLSDLIGNADLPVLSEGRGALVSQRVTGERARQFLCSAAGLGVAEVGQTDLLRALAERPGWAQEKPLEWHRALIAYLARAELADPELRALRGAKILPVGSGWASAEQGVFFSPKDARLRISGARFISEEVLVDETSQAFLRKLGVAAPREQTLAERVILPALQRHQSGEVLPEPVLDEYVQFLLAYAGSADALAELGERLGKLLPLRAADGGRRAAAQFCAPVDDSGKETLAAYLLSGGTGEQLAEKPGGQDLAALVRLWRWLGVKPEPSVDSLIRAFQDAGWCADRPAEWHCTLYTYLDRHASDTQLRRLAELPVVRLVPGARPLHGGRPDFIFLAQAEGAVGELCGVFAEDSIAFADPAGYAAPGEAHRFEADPKRARALLTKLGVDVLRPQELIQRVVVAQFQRAATEKVDDARLLGYSHYVQQALARDERFAESAAWSAFRKVALVKTSSGDWKPPAQVYLTKAYGATDFEMLLRGLKDVWLTSSDYLSLSADRRAWRKYFESLNVLLRLPAATYSQNRSFTDLLSEGVRDYLDEIGEYHRANVLRYYERHRIAGHARIAYLGSIIASGEPQRLQTLLLMLTEHWAGDGGYRHLRSAQYSYQLSGYWSIAQPKPSYTTWLLQRSKVLPTTKGLLSGRQIRVYRRTDEIYALCGESVAYLTYSPSDRARELLCDVLGVIWDEKRVSPDDVLAYLRVLKQSGEATPAGCALIYRFLGAHDVRERLEKEELIFLPAPGRSWWRPSELFWKNFSGFFGDLRGYVGDEPAYRDLHAAFEVFGVNVDNPGPRDWADLLNGLGRNPPEDIEAAKPIIWRAYRELEGYFNAHKGESDPEWWEEFAGEVPLLMERDGFSDEPFYVFDSLSRYRALRDKLPFIWLSESHRRVDLLLDKLRGRRISDEKVIAADVRVGQEIAGADAVTIRAGIIGERVFIRSLLAHKNPRDEREYSPLVSLLTESSPFDVKIVDQIDIRLRVVEEASVELPLSDEVRAYYRPESSTLYLVAGVVGEWEEIGLGVAGMFGQFEESIRSEIMQLFAQPNRKKKERLFERLQIPLCEPLPSSEGEQPGDARGSAGQARSDEHGEAQGLADPQGDNPQAEPGAQPESDNDGDAPLDEPNEPDADDDLGSEPASASPPPPDAQPHREINLSGQLPVRPNSSGERQQVDRGSGGYDRPEFQLLPGLSSGDTPTGGPPQMPASGRGAELSPGAPADSPAAGEPRRPASSGGGRPPAGTSTGVGGVYADEGGADTAETEGDDDDIELGKAGVERVLEYEVLHGRVAESMPHTNPGYDVISRGRDGIVRYIEVKSTRGEWRSRGVGLTHTQVDFGREEEHFWLYVVEYAESPESCRITRIHSPTSKIRRYYFGPNWRTLAAEAEALPDA